MVARPGRDSGSGAATNGRNDAEDAVVTLTLAETAATRIAQEIASGAIRPGSRLPPERELAQRLGLSRGALREALRTLESVGLLDAHVGRGRFVADTGSDGTSVALQTWMELQPSGDLVALRRILEPAAVMDMPATQVGACALRAAELLAQMRSAQSRGATGSVIEHHTQFHLLLVQFGSTRLLRSLVSTMILASARWQPDILREPPAARQWMTLHAGIVDALDKGDVAETARQVNAHMQTRFAFSRSAG
jgi:GntR family transcriptional repressor for pyruvate dehydrogenase complex